MVVLLFALLATPSFEVAPMPRLKADCQCPDTDIHYRARAALALQAAPKTVPTIMPSAAQMAAKRALEAADKAIKATPKKL